MINIISKAYCRHYQSGPKKVVDNLIKGLERISYPYVVNKQLDATQRLWIHDDMLALEQAVKLPNSVKVVVGPNLVVLPAALPPSLDMSRFVYIHPSDWAKAFWEFCGFTACPIVAWPTGIDTEEFAPTHSVKSFILVYFKQRLPQELAEVTAVLERSRLPYKLLIYPTYRETVYKQLLGQARYAIWVGRQESQGIALQEALATNTPMLVCDVARMGQWQASKKEMDVFGPREQSFPATSAEFFDNTCGIKIKDLEQFPEALTRMEAELQTFTPRIYIQKHLSLEKQARDFVELYNTYFEVSFEEGKKERLLRSGNWVNRNLKHRAVFLAKDIVKSIIRFSKQNHGRV